MKNNNLLGLFITSTLLASNFSQADCLSAYQQRKDDACFSSESHQKMGILFSAAIATVNPIGIIEVIMATKAANANLSRCQTATRDLNLLLQAENGEAKEELNDFNDLLKRANPQQDLKIVSSKLTKARKENYLCRSGEQVTTYEKILKDAINDQLTEGPAPIFQNTALVAHCKSDGIDRIAVRTSRAKEFALVNAYRSCDVKQGHVQKYELVPVNNLDVLCAALCMSRDQSKYSVKYALGHLMSTEFEKIKTDCDKAGGTLINRNNPHSIWGNITTADQRNSCSVQSVPEDQEPHVLPYL
jgi:hypothetical protein